MKLISIFAFAFLLACNQPAADTHLADEAAIRQADLDWSKATEAGQYDDSTGYYSYLLDDEIVLAPNAPMATGKEAIRKMLEPMFATPGFKVKWAPVKVEASGDMGYTIGTFEMSVSDSTGTNVIEKGNYLEIWKRQAGGKWKVTAESFNSDMPVPEPPAN